MIEGQRLSSELAGEPLPEVVTMEDEKMMQEAKDAEEAEEEEAERQRVMDGNSSGNIKKRFGEMQQVQRLLIDQV